MNIIKNKQQYIDVYNQLNTLVFSKETFNTDDLQKIEIFKSLIATYQDKHIKITKPKIGDKTMFRMDQSNINKSKLKKRLRKKNHVGEFTELGVSILVILNKKVKYDAKALDKIYDNLLSYLSTDFIMFTVGGDKEYVLCTLFDFAINGKINELNLDNIKNIIKSFENVLDVSNFSIFNAWSTSKEFDTREELISLEIKNRLGIIQAENSEFKTLGSFEEFKKDIK